MKPVAHFQHNFHPADRVTNMRHINVKLYMLEQQMKECNLSIQIEVKLFEIVGTTPAPQVVTYDATKED